jgi:hypothetical protein
MSLFELSKVQGIDNVTKSIIRWINKLQNQIYRCTSKHSQYTSTYLKVTQELKPYGFEFKPTTNRIKIRTLKFQSGCLGPNKDQLSNCAMQLLRRAST